MIAGMMVLRTKAFMLMVALSFIVDNAKALADMRENILLARCRASCLQEFTSESTNSRDDECHKSSDCYMCWNSCRLFQGNSPGKSTLCADHTEIACFPGCQTACRFYDMQSQKNLTPPIPLSDPLPAKMAPPQLVSSGHLKWSDPVWKDGVNSLEPGEVIVYIVLNDVADVWSQHIQTSTNKAIIPNSIKDSKFRLLAVTQTGLIAMTEYDPKNTQNEIQNTLNDSENTPIDSKEDPNHSASTLKDFDSIRDGLRLAKNSEINGQKWANTKNDRKLAAGDHSFSHGFRKSTKQENNVVLPPSVTVDRLWEIKLELVSSEQLANVAVSWEPRGSDQVDYMVTWAETAGGLSGHLVTKKPRAELSLWTSQKYEIQVNLLGPLGNSVLKSLPKVMSFLPDGITESVRSTQTPTPTIFTSPKVPTHVSTKTSNPYLLNSREYNSFNKKENFHFPSNKSKEIFQRKSVNSNSRIFNRKSVTPSYHVPFQPRWINEASYSKNIEKVKEVKDSTNLKNLKNVDEPLTAEQDSSSALAAWGACFGVGAVIIIIAVVIIVRTLRRNSSDKKRRADDFLSDTTVSSVNSSAPTTSSQLSRIQRPDSESSWPYETFYGVTSILHNNIKNNPPLPQHSPPPFPPTGGALTPVITYHQACAHAHMPSCSSHNTYNFKHLNYTTNPNPRVKIENTPYNEVNTSYPGVMIENKPYPGVKIEGTPYVHNYMLALDHTKNSEIAARV